MHKAVIHYTCGARPMLTTPLESHQTSLTEDPLALRGPRRETCGRGFYWGEGGFL
jgi:hypothetical protein